MSHHHIISKTSWLWPRERECRALYETFLDISSLSLIQCSQSNCACRMLPPRNFQWNHLICFDLNCDKNGSREQHWSHVGAAFACNIDSLTATLSGDDFQCCLENNIFILDSVCYAVVVFFFRHTLDTSTICETCKVSLASMSERMYFMLPQSCTKLRRERTWILIAPTEELKNRIVVSYSIKVAVQRERKKKWES